jgi:hypothetical protein
VSDPEWGERASHTWSKLEELSGQTEMVLRKEVPVV